MLEHREGIVGCVPGNNVPVSCLLTFSMQRDVLYHHGKPPSALQSVGDHIPAQLRDAHPPAPVSGPGPLLPEPFHVTAQVSGTCLPASDQARTPSPTLEHHIQVTRKLHETLN